MSRNCKYGDVYEGLEGEVFSALIRRAPADIPFGFDVLPWYIRTFDVRHPRVANYCRYYTNKILPPPPRRRYSIRCCFIYAALLRLCLSLSFFSLLLYIYAEVRGAARLWPPI